MNNPAGDHAFDLFMSINQSFIYCPYSLLVSPTHCPFFWEGLYIFTSSLFNFLPSLAPVIPSSQLPYLLPTENTLDETSLMRYAELSTL